MSASTWLAVEDVAPLAVGQLDGVRRYSASNLKIGRDRSCRACAASARLTSSSS